MRIRSLIAIVTVSVLVMAACGGSDDTGGDDGSPTPSADGGGGGTASLPLEEWLNADLDDCAEAPTGEPLKIGYAADLSEVGGFADGPGSEAATFMAELINCAGGVEGHPVEVVVQDIQGDPEVTQRAANDLLDEGVHAILGPPFADFGLPLLQVVGGQVPTLFVASTEPTLASAEQLSFLVSFDDTRQATEAALFAREQGFETAITFSVPGPYFGYNPQIFTEVFEENGGTVLSDYTFSLEDTDFSTQVNQAANLDPAPDLLYTAMITPQLGTLLGQMQGADLRPEVIITDAGDATRVWDLGEPAEGVYFTTHAFPEPGSPMETFLAAYEEARGEPLETVSFGALAADAVILVADAFVRSGMQGDAAAIGEALKTAEGVEVVTGSVSYAGTDGVPRKPLYIEQVEGGEPALIEVVPPPEG
jgi:branched-chain amino acid transport system substrate-binding protein